MREIAINVAFFYITHPEQTLSEGNAPAWLLASVMCFRRCENSQQCVQDV
jgi:hypothetical protein